VPLIEVTLAAVATLDASPASVRVIIREIPATHWAAGAETLAERRAATAEEA
jgi:4-oxalocrotonate tautomerase